MEEKLWEPESIYDAEINEIFKSYQICEKFHCLLDAGGYNDQNPFWLECMEIIIDEINEWQAEEMKKR